MKKKYLALLMILAVVSLIACKTTETNESSKQETKVSETKVSETTKEETTKEETTLEETTVSETTKPSFSGDFAAISNVPMNWGVGTALTADNRPASAVDYQEKFKNYAVDFIKENEKVIYLTFDEGYENGYTPQILDTLKAKNVSAVFFVTLPYAKSQPDLIKRMIDEGHVVASHSVSHPSKGMPSLSTDVQLSEYKELHEYIKSNYNYEMYLFRPPVGIFSEQSLAVAQSFGYKTVLWSFAYADWNPDSQPSEAEGLDKTLSKLHNGGIYLLHAVSKTNANILGQFIDGTRAKGFEFKKYTQ